MIHDLHSNFLCAFIFFLLSTDRKVFCWKRLYQTSSSAGNKSSQAVSAKLSFSCLIAKDTGDMAVLNSIAMRKVIVSKIQTM